MQTDHNPTVHQLTILFNSLFNKDNLRKNVYIFNALNQQLCIPVRIIAKERRIANVTHDHSLILEALRQCPLVEVKSNQEVRVLVKGDELLVRLRSSKGNHISKKQINNLTRHMKSHYHEQKGSFLIEFQSHAAVIEFIERVKNAQNKQYEYTILEKDPYKCLEQCISAYRKEKKSQNKSAVIREPQYNPQFNSQMYYYQEYYAQLAAHYPVFIRRAVDSDQQENNKPQKPKKVEKKVINGPKIEKKNEYPKIELNSEDFPSFDDLNIQDKQSKAK